MKACLPNVAVESQIELNVESALMGAGMITAGGFRGTDNAQSRNLGLESIAIRKMENERPKLLSNWIAQRRMSIKNNACFYVIKKGADPENMQLWSASTQMMSFWKIESKGRGRRTSLLKSWRPLWSDYQWVANKSTEPREVSIVRNNFGPGNMVSNSVYGILANVSSSVTDLPVRPLFVFRGKLNGIAVKISKEWQVYH